jgi:predicted HTH domain antitoxin
MDALNITSETEQTLRQAFGPDLTRAALEALAIEGYRTAKLTAGEVAGILGLTTSIEAQSWMAQRGVELNYSVEDLDADRATLDKLLSETT